MTQEEMAEVLWEIYLSSCICHMDHGSLCTCEASSLSARSLEKLLGSEWHGIMCKRRTAAG